MVRVYQITWPRMQEDSNIYIYRCVNLKSHNLCVTRHFTLIITGYKGCVFCQQPWSDPPCANTVTFTVYKSQVFLYKRHKELYGTLRQKCDRHMKLHLQVRPALVCIPVDIAGACGCYIGEENRDQIAWCGDAIVLDTRCTV